MNVPTDGFSRQDRQTLRLIWAAVTGGVVLLCVVMVVLVRSGTSGGMEGADLFIVLNALVGVATIAIGFLVQKKLDEALESADSYEAAILTIRTRCILSIAVVEASALLAAVSTLVTGELMNLAFVIPFFAFAWLFFPSDQRFAYWKAIVDEER